VGKKKKKKFAQAAGKQFARTSLGAREENEDREIEGKGGNIKKFEKLLNG